MENWIRRRRFPKVRKFRLKENVAHTEDNIIIYNVVVTAIPRQTTQTQIKNLFRKFGRIKKIQFYLQYKKCRPNQTPTRVIIKYCNAMSATKVLLGDHFIGLKRLTVEPCDSWRQPSNVDIERRLSNLNDSKQSTNSILSLLSELNDDCLYNVYNYMPISKQAFLAKTSEQAKQVFHTYSKIKYKTLDMNTLNDMTVWERFEFIEAVGEHVKEIWGFRSGKVCSRTLEFIAQYCPNITSVEMYETFFKSIDLCAFLEKMTNLQKLRLNKSMICNGALAKIGTLKNLQCLDLAGNKDICGLYIPGATSLNFLNLSKCCPCSPTTHVSLLQNLPKLKCLQLPNGIHTPNYYNIIAEKCSELEVLGVSLDPNFNYEVLATLPNLTKFQATSSNFNRLRGDFFKNLRIYKSTSLKGLWIDPEYVLTDQIVEDIGKLEGLEFLSLRKYLNDKQATYLYNLKNLKFLDVSDTVSLSNFDLYKLLKNLPNLLELDIQYCQNLSTSFVLSLIHFFEYQHHERKEPLTIYVACNRHEILELDEIYKNMNIKPDKGYLQLEFKNRRRANNFLEIESPFELFKSGQ